MAVYSQGLFESLCIINGKAASAYEVPEFNPDDLTRICRLHDLQKRQFSGPQHSISAPPNFNTPITPNSLSVVEINQEEFRSRSSSRNKAKSKKKLFINAPASPTKSQMSSIGLSSKLFPPLNWFLRRPSF